MVDARGIDADYKELAHRLRTNADYDTPPGSLTKAHAFMAACREYLVMFEEVERGQRFRLRMNHTEVRHALTRAEKWVAANADLGTSSTDLQPSRGYTHVDLQGFRD